MNFFSILVLSLGVMGSTRHGTMDQLALYHKMTGNRMYVELARNRLLSNHNFAHVLIDLGGPLPQPVATAVCAQRESPKAASECQVIDTLLTGREDVSSPRVRGRPRRQSAPPQPLSADSALLPVAVRLPAILVSLTAARVAAEEQEDWMNIVHEKLNIPLFNALTLLRMGGPMDPREKSSVLFATVLEQLHYRLVSSMAPPWKDARSEFQHVANVLQFGLVHLMTLAQVDIPVRHAAPVVDAPATWFCFSSNVAATTTTTAAPVPEISSDEKREQFRVLSQFMNTQLDAGTQQVGRVRADASQFQDLRYQTLERHTALRGAIALFPSLAFNAEEVNAGFLTILDAVTACTDISSIDQLVVELDTAAQFVRHSFYDLALSL